MRHKSYNGWIPQTSGIALIEMLVTTGVVAITGVIIYYVLYNGLILFAKNTAVNLAHQQARTAAIQVEQDIHSCVSIPELISSPGVVVSGTGPAAGVSFQLVAGPADHNMFKVNSNAAANATQVVVATNGYFTPVVGERLIVPACQIEQDITAVSTTGGNSTCTVGAAIGNPITVTASGTSYNIVAFFTDRVSYVVQNGRLLYYPRNNSATSSVLTTDITTAQPFSIPTTPLGAAYSRFVAAINLSSADPSATNQNYKAANMFINAQVPYRSRLTIYQ